MTYSFTIRRRLSLGIALAILAAALSAADFVSAATQPDPVKLILNCAGLFLLGSASLALPLGCFTDFIYSVEDTPEGRDFVVSERRAGRTKTVCRVCAFGGTLSAARPPMRKRIYSYVPIFYRGMIMYYDPPEAAGEYVIRFAPDETIKALLELS